MSKKLPMRNRLKMISLVLMIGSFGLLGYNVAEIWMARVSDDDEISMISKVPSPKHVVSEERQAAEGTDEQQPHESSIADYMVGPEMPRVIRSSRISMEGRVLPMGVNPDGSMQAPVNIYDAGWYNGSAKPGSPGAAVIDAHASGRTRQGLFGYLNTLEKGDEVEIEKGDGTKIKYKFVFKETKPYQEVDMNKVLSVYGDATEGLNLITCDGDWVNDKQTMKNRVVVYTERI